MEVHYNKVVALEVDAVDKELVEDASDMAAAGAAAGRAEEEDLEHSLQRAAVETSRSAKRGGGKSSKQ